MFILHVDDEPAVRKTVRDCLREDGHQVDSAESVADALEMAARAKPPYDAFITDGLIPGETPSNEPHGAAIILAAGLRELGLMQPMIVFSGSRVENPQELLVPGRYRHIEAVQKPSVSDLANVIGALAMANDTQPTA